MMTSRQTYIGSPDNPKTTAFVAYITFIGWVISYFFLYPNNRSSLSSFHIRQSLFIHIISFILKVAFSFYYFSSGIGYIIIAILALGLFVLWLVGIWDAMSGRERTLPVVGNTAQSIFRKL